MLGFGRNLLLTFVSLLFLVGLCEGGYRLYVRAFKPLYRPSSIPHLGWEFTPGFQRPPGGYLINRSGFRDRTNGEWPGWLPGVEKIIFLGDSITVGAGIPDYNQTYPALVEGFLREKSLPAQTANLAVEATNTLQHLSILKYKALPLGPDRIVLGYFLNDIEARAVEKQPPATEFILRHFRFGTFLITRLGTAIRNHRHQEGNRPDSLFQCPAYASGILRQFEGPARQNNEDILLRMAGECRQQGISFGMVVFPFESQIRGECSDFPQKRLAEFCRENNIPMLDLRPIFKETSFEKSLYDEKDDIHPNEEGHKAAARAIAEWLLSLR